MAAPVYTPKLLQDLVGGAAPTLTVPQRQGPAAQVQAVAPQAVMNPLVAGGQAPVQNLSDLSGSALYEKKLLVAKQQLDQQQAMEGEAFGKALQAAVAQDRDAIQRAQQAYDGAVKNSQQGVSEWGLSPAETLQKYKQMLEDAKSAAYQHQQQISQPYYAKKKQQDALYQNAVQTVQRLKTIDAGNADLAGQNKAGRAAYDQQLADYNKGTDAYTAYQKQKADYDQAEAQRQADIAAGKYNVDPYRFIHQGASLPEILELRKQLNAGVARPQMRVPTAAVAPTEVQAPGEKPADFVERAPMAYEPVADDVANFIGYKPPPPPAPAPPPTAPPAPTPAKVEEKPATGSAPTPPTPDQKPVTPEKAPAPAPAGQQPLTTQMTSSQASTPTQQTVTQPVQKQEPINKATSLEQQTAGTVAGQASSTTSQKPAPTPQGTPQNIVAPKPFAPADKKFAEEDNAWEI